MGSNISKESHIQKRKIGSFEEAGITLLYINLRQSVAQVSSLSKKLILKLEA